MWYEHYWLDDEIRQALKGHNFDAVFVGDGRIVSIRKLENGEWIEKDIEPIEVCVLHVPEWVRIWSNDPWTATSGLITTPQKGKELVKRFVRGE